MPFRPLVPLFLQAQVIQKAAVDLGNVKVVLSRRLCEFNTRPAKKAALIRPAVWYVRAAKYSEKRQFLTCVEG